MQEQASGLRKLLSTKSGKLALGVAIIFVLALIGGLSGKHKDTSNSQTNATSNTPVTSTQNSNGIEVSTTNQQPVKTPQEILEDNLATVVKNTGSTDVTYRDIKLEKSDANRPADTQMVTVNVNVSSFYNKNALLKDTGKLSSSILQAVYGVADMKAYDVFVNYYGEVTDKYGNKKDDIILVYDIDKTTFQKVNWGSFDQSTLCSFLDNESKGTDTFNTACNVLANIQ